MRGLLIVVGLLIASRARANPVSADDLKSASDKVTEHLQEPIGLAVTANLPKLGLQKGDVILTVNGKVSSERTVFTEPLADGATALHLEVLRAGKPLSLKLAIRPKSIEQHRERPRLKESLDRLRAEKLGQVTSKGSPSGVAIRSLSWFGMDGPASGDIIRKIDGKIVKTAEQVVAAVEAGVTKKQIVFDMERAGLTYVFTIEIDEDPTVDPDLDKIQKISDTSYKIPKSLIEKVVLNPIAFTKGARVVPAMKNGKAEGIKLYAIRPGSIYARIGFQNGDTLVSINGFALTSVDKGLEIYTKLREATSFEVEVLRRGKPVTIQIRIE